MTSTDEAAVMECEASAVSVGEGPESESRQDGLRLEALLLEVRLFEANCEWVAVGVRPL